MPLGMKTLFFKKNQLNHKNKLLRILIWMILKNLYNQGDLTYQENPQQIQIMCTYKKQILTMEMRLIRQVLERLWGVRMQTNGGKRC
ncbi:unnamed protein product [Prunus armeniaca]